MDNLRTPTREEAKEMQLKSAEKRKANSSARHLLEVALETAARMDKDGVLSPDGTQILDKDGNPMSLKEVGLLRLALQYAGGDKDAIKLGSQLLGELKEQIEVQSLPAINCNVFGE